MAVDDDRGDGGVSTVRFVTEELAGADLIAKREPDLFGSCLAGTLPGGAGSLALARHGGIETGLRDAAALGTQRILGQVEGKAVGIVKLEGDLAGKRLVFPKLICFLG